MSACACYHLSAKLSETETVLRRKVKKGLHHLLPAVSLLFFRSIRRKHTKEIEEKNSFQLENGLLSSFESV